MRLGIIFCVLLGLGGCGPLSSPMLPRLRPEEQRQVDQAWENILTPVQRVDRQTLLDTNVLFWLYMMGVDRMHMTSEKYFSGGMVVMEIDCDRASPDSDQFTITVLDHQGHTLRRERYSRSEVDESSRTMGKIPYVTAADLNTIQVQIVAGGATTRPATGPVTRPAMQPETPEEQKARQDAERRLKAAIAATEPARLKPAPGVTGSP